MNNSEKAIKMEWKPFIKLYMKIKIPWVLYILAFGLGLLTTRVSLQLAPLQTKIQLGQFMEGNAFYWFIGFSLLFILTTIGRNMSLLFGEQRVNKSVRDVLLGKILRIKTERLNEEKPGGLVSRVTNDTELAGQTPGTITGVFASFYGLVGAIVGMYALNPTLTSTYALIIPLVIFIFWIIGHLQFKMEYKIFHSYGVMTDFFSEHLINMKHIKAQATENTELIDGKKAIETRYRADIYAAIMGSVQTIIGHMINTASMLIIFVLGAYYVRNGVFQTQDLVTFHNFSLIMLPSIYELLTQFQTIKGAQGATAKVAKLLEVEEEEVKRKNSIGTSNEDIVFDNVEFGYGNQQILHDISFTIPEGKTTAILGRNGTGKSTIFNLLVRYYEPASGTIKFGSQDVREIHLDEWRRKIVYVSQNSPILSGTIRDNILYGIRREVKNEELIRAASLANAYEFIEKYTNGFDTDVGEAGSKLSGGQKQRIAIARALILNPEYLLLDEATCNLDSRSETLISKEIDRLMEGKTVIKIAHNLQSVQSADHIVILEKGFVAAEGTHNELYEKNEYYKDFVELHKT